MPENTACRFQLELHRIQLFEKNESISSCRRFASDSVSLPRLDNPTGACPTHRRQWADFLVSLMAPLHRQYKTARTELVGICYWKHGRCQFKHRLRAVMFCSVVAQGARTKVLKLSVGLRTQSVECSKLGKTRIIADANPGWLEMPHFLNRMYPMHSSWNQQISCLSYYLSLQKETPFSELCVWMKSVYNSIFWMYKSTS